MSLEDVMRQLKELRDNVEEMKVGLRALVPRVPPFRPRVPREVKERLWAQRIVTDKDLDESRKMYMDMLDIRDREGIRRLRNDFEMKASSTYERLEEAEEANRLEPYAIPPEIVDSKRKLLAFWVDLREEAERRLR